MVAEYSPEYISISLNWNEPVKTKCNFLLAMIPTFILG
jgi:hypothetical protein